MKKQNEKILVGMGGWDLFPFEGVFYPKRKDRGFRKLEYYSRFFDFVEVNATFYNSTLRRAQAKRWVRDVEGNRNFVFVIKLYRGFTHTYEANQHDVYLVSDFLNALAEEGKLAGLLIQFPYRFTNIRENREHVFQLSRIFRRYTLYVEVRHATWNHPDAYRFFFDNRIHPVNVDLPGIRNHMPLTCEAWNNRAYFRMMGRNALTWNRPWRLNGPGTHLVSDRYRYRYSAQELDELLELIETVRMKSAETFVVFHNDPDAGSLVNGFQLRHLLGKRKLLMPSPLVQANPELKGIAHEVNTDYPLFTTSPAPEVSGTPERRSLAS
jgi:uncharacterized protein YecE (DUF72 family)